MNVTHDGKLLIAVGRSRKSAQWQNKELQWSELLDKLSQTTRTRETAAEYAALPKGERDTIKDVGGFVGGYLKNGRRSNASVVNRCLVCLDADYADEGLLDDLDLTFINAYALYSTHSHTPEKMRLRLIIPLSRTVAPDEYAAVSRRIADDLTLTRFDPTTFEPARLMYWPSTPEDGEFVFHYSDAPFLDPDAVLATYSDWTDASLWPTTRPLEERTRAKIGKQEDPLEKKGIIGAFCRAHSITDVLEHILSERYTPTEQDDRYTFVGGSTTGGLVVYDDKYAYSHHATDPAGGKLCNAFDLVRLHLFTPGSTAPDGSQVGDEANSISAMRAYAAADEATRIQMTEERLRQADEDFSEEPTERSQSNTVEIAADWQSKLAYDKMGNLKNTLTNLLLIMQNDPQLKGVVFNQLSDGMEIRDDIAPVPWKHPSKFWRDADDKQIISYIETRYGAFSNRNYDVAIGKVTDDRSYHPIRDYLSSLPEWDRTPRIETLLIDYLGAPDNRYVRAVTRKTLCAAVKRVLQPGIKFDTMLVLNGPQGVGKSTLIAKLGGEWFNDSLSLNDTKDKTAAEKLQGFWIMEIGELAGLRKAEVETLRSFLSRQNDMSVFTCVMMYPVKNRFESSAGKSRLLFSFGGMEMTENHKARAPTVLRTGRPNREPLDVDEVITYGMALAEDLGVSIPKCKRLRRMLKRRIPIPQIYQGADYRLWIDRYYIAVQRLADESLRYVYLTRIHIRSELLANQRMQKQHGVPLLDSEALTEFAAARRAMERFQTDYALRLFCSTAGGTARLDLDAAWSCA